MFVQNGFRHNTAHTSGLDQPEKRRDEMDDENNQTAHEQFYRCPKTTEFRANLEFAMNRFAFVADEARWQCPRSVTLLPVVDLNFPVPIYLIWRKDNQSPLLQKFVAHVEALMDRQ